MKIEKLPFIVFLLLTISFFPLSQHYATSLVPGWHTTIFPPYFIWQSIVVLVMLLVSIAYWKLSKIPDRINWTFFIIHFILTIPLIIYLKFDSVIINLATKSKDVLLIPIAFALGQILFIVQYIRSLQRLRIEKR
jgi:hypothetical protein